MEHALGLWETLRAYHEVPDIFRRLTDQFPVGGVGTLWGWDSRWEPHEAVPGCRGPPRAHPAGGHAPRLGERPVPDALSPPTREVGNHPRAFAKSSPWRLKGVRYLFGFGGEDIAARVRRKSDGKEFYLGLAELKAIDKRSPSNQLLDDYAVFFTNYR